MATDIKISQMPAASTLAGDELIPIVQSGTNKSTTVNKIKEGLATSEQLAGKVDKDGSKVLSEKNFTAAYETKLKGIADNANNYTHPAGNAVSKPAGFYKISTDSNSHVASATPVAKSDITALGIPAQDTTYTEATTGAAGLMSSTDKSKLDGIAPGANNYVLPAASASLGGVKQGAAVEDATSAEDIVAQFNALLASLRTAGVIATGAAAASMMAARSSETVIDFIPPMPLEKGKLYKENGIVYRCIQTSKLSISNKLSDLVGHYVELV